MLSYEDFLKYFSLLIYNCLHAKGHHIFLFKVKCTASCLIEFGLNNIWSAKQLGVAETNKGLVLAGIWVIRLHAENKHWMSQR